MLKLSHLFICSPGIIDTNRTFYTLSQDVLFVAIHLAPDLQRASGSPCWCCPFLEAQAPKNNPGN